MTPTAAGAALTRLARLGDRLECAAAAGVDSGELDPILAEFDRLARGFEPEALTQAQRRQVAEVSAQVARILSRLADQQAQMIAQGQAAQSRDNRLRQAYGVGR